MRPLPIVYSNGNNYIKREEVVNNKLILKDKF